MSDLTKGQLDDGFVHQVRMYQGVGKERMHRIIDALFIERHHAFISGSASSTVGEELEVRTKERLADIGEEPLSSGFGATGEEREE